MPLGSSVPKSIGHQNNGRCFAGKRPYSLPMSDIGSTALFAHARVGRLAAEQVVEIERALMAFLGLAR